MAESVGESEWLDLADAVTALRGQLIEAQTRAEGSAIQLTVEEVAIELALELRRSDRTTEQRPHPHAFDPY